MADDPPPNIDTLTAQLAAASAELANAKARISELNNEAKGHRLNGDNHKRAAEEAAVARDAAIADKAAKLAELEAAKAEAIKAAETKAAEALSKAEQRAINADLRIAAKDAGAHDASDILALLDRSKVKTNDAGDVTNAADLMAELKKAKPHLFGATSTSNPKDPPKPKDPAAKKVSEMTDAEYEASKRNRAWRNN